MKNKAVEFLLNILFPRKCVFCGELLPFSNEDEICSECMNDLPFCLAYERCKICGRPNNENEKCPDCASMSYRGFDRACSAYIYKDAVKDALVRFKSEKYAGYSRLFAKHISAVIRYDLKDHDIDIVVSVPPRIDRMKSENYDQAMCLAKEISKEINKPYFKNTLVQAERRKKQSDLSADERRINAEGNYRVKKPELVSGRKILLVDDICTTGATLSECAKMLKKSGAAKVYCVTAATVLTTKAG